MPHCGAHSERDVTGRRVRYRSHRHPLLITAAFDATGVDRIREAEEVFIHVKRIYYSNGSVLTGDYIADAILDLAQVVATRGASTSIDIPVILPDGATGHAQLLLGPASSMLSVTEPVVPQVRRGWDEDRAKDAVRGVRASIRSFTRQSHPVSVIDPDNAAYLSDFDGL